MEDNKLIAKFMGVNKPYPEYETSLKELQLVLDKIGDILFHNLSIFWYWDDCLVSKEIDIKYQAIIEFIDWYNNKLSEKAKLN